MLSATTILLGFDATSITVAEADVRDCMLAIDLGVVLDKGGGRYVANQSSAFECLFREGHKVKSPRRISLSLEPVITFAALARLHLAHRWPRENLGMQSKGWGFDLVAYGKPADKNPRIPGEVKKSSVELTQLKDDFLKLSDSGASATGEVKENSARKWRELLTTRPKLVWLGGPNAESYVFTPSYADGVCCGRSTLSTRVQLNSTNKERLPCVR